jgi:hypothetical protein
MVWQGELALLPSGSEIIGERLAYCRSQEGVTFFNPGGPILHVRNGDAEGIRVAAVVLANPEVSGGVKVAVLAQALGVERTLIWRARRRAETEGIAALATRKSGPRSAHKLVGERLRSAQRQLDRGLGNTAVAAAVGVSEGAIRKALREGRLVRPASSAPSGETEAPPLVAPAERAKMDEASAAGMAVKWNEERSQARRGELIEALPRFEAASSVAKAGVLLALPVLVAQGLFSVGREVYGRLRNGFFGLDTVLITLAFMALLRLRSAEQLSSHAPGEFGRILGLDRAPETKTLRRKLNELGTRRLGRTFVAGLARFWAEEDRELLGFLYIDGHVRPYNGRKHKLPKTHVPRRRLCMPATTDYWVNDEFADPVFFLTSPAHEGLLKAVDELILPEIRELIGPKRRATLVLDREGWSPQLFRAWHEEGFDILTYRKGNYEPWPEEVFEPIAGRALRRKRIERLAERPLELSNGFAVREVRCLTEDGHQTSIVTTRPDLSTAEVAERMFSRWRQENFFRYMRHEFALDHLPTYATEAADPERTMPNPQRKAARKVLVELLRERGKLERSIGAAVLEEGAASAEQLARPLTERIDALRAAEEELRAEITTLPERVPVGTLLEPAEVVRLEEERKAITDAVKMTAYRSETELFRLVSPLLGGGENGARAFLRRVFQLPADLLPDPERQELRVRFHTMSDWRSNRALAGLCQLVNEYPTTFPGSDLRMIFEPPPVAPINSSGQEP